MEECKPNTEEYIKEQAAIPAEAPKRKKSFSDVAGGVAGVVGYIEKTIPVVKNFLQDIGDIVSLLSTGQVQSHGGRQFTNYSSQYTYQTRPTGYYSEPSWQTQRPEATITGDIYFATEQAANDCLAMCMDDIARNGVCRLAEEYRHAQLDSMVQPAFYNWGWRDLSMAYVTQVPGKPRPWLLKMPPQMYIQFR